LISSIPWKSFSILFTSNCYGLCFLCIFLFHSSLFRVFLLVCQRRI
jgi:hypothetical protein